jgi:quercetin dioxygenase-like cupin family protein
MCWGQILILSLSQESRSDPECERTINMLLFILLTLIASAPAQTPAPGMMPYTAIHKPEFVAASEATFLRDDDILLGVASGKVAKAFPAADLTQHGAVSDQLPDGPISVTWCGVCNTGLVFRADVKGRTLHFQYDRMVSGNEVQKDLETGTSWQQATGEAIDGPLKGTRLKLYPVVRTTWAAWRKQYPHTIVLKPLPGYLERMPDAARRIRDVTRIGLEGAPRGASSLDKRLPPRETVAGLEVGRESVAFPFSELRIARVVNERVGGLPVVIIHQPSSDTTTAFEARIKSKVLRFQPANDDATAVVDRETRSTWNAYGLALDGPMKGTQLTQVVLVPQFWFAWSQFRPATRVFTTNTAPASASVRVATWETLSRLPVPDDIEPVIRVSRFDLAAAPPVATPIGAGHTHQGPVFGYILQGEIENQVEPDAPARYKANEFFVEPAGRLHRFMRNVRTTEPAVLLTFQAGSKGQPVPYITVLLEEQFPAAKNQEATLLRLTLPPGARSDPHPAPGRGLVYVLSGKVETATATNQLRAYTSGETLFQPGVGPVLTFRNVSSSEPATLLLYHVGPKVK